MPTSIFNNILQMLTSILSVDIHGVLLTVKVFFRHITFSKHEVIALQCQHQLNILYLKAVTQEFFLPLETMKRKYRL